MYILLISVQYITIKLKDQIVVFRKYFRIYANYNLGKQIYHFILIFIMLEFNIKMPNQRRQ